MRRLKRTPFGLFIFFLALFCLLTASSLAGPVMVETKSLSHPAADPFAVFVSLGPQYEFNQAYRVLEPGACSVLAYRVLILHYANYENLVVEELGFSGSKCEDPKVLRSLSINGVALGYALGEGTHFARNLEFRGWEAFDTFVVSSAKKDFRFRLNRDGGITAEAAEAISILDYNGR